MSEGLADKLDEMMELLKREREVLNPQHQDPVENDDDLSNHPMRSFLRALDEIKDLASKPPGSDELALGLYGLWDWQNDLEVLLGNAQISLAEQARVYIDSVSKWTAGPALRDQYGVELLPVAAEIFAHEKLETVSVTGGLSIDGPQQDLEDSWRVLRRFYGSSSLISQKDLAHKLKMTEAKVSRSLTAASAVFDLLLAHNQLQEIVDKNQLKITSLSSLPKNNKEAVRKESMAQRSRTRIYDEAGQRMVNGMMVEIITITDPGRGSLDSEMIQLFDKFHFGGLYFDTSDLEMEDPKMGDKIFVCGAFLVPKLFGDKLVFFNPDTGSEIIEELKASPLYGKRGRPTIQSLRWLEENHLKSPRDVLDSFEEMVQVVLEEGF